jgi:hypothetical protein
VAQQLGGNDGQSLVASSFRFKVAHAPEKHDVIHDVLRERRRAERLRSGHDFGVNVLWHPSLGMELDD